jgi:NAD(P)-dependent dehydrogenase (short-subunit alcohol dehydrogenase family)
VSLRLSGKICVITGTGGSVGREAAMAFARAEAVGEDRDLPLTVTHLLSASLGPAGGSVVLASVVVLPELTGTLRLYRLPGLRPYTA